MTPKIISDTVAIITDAEGTYMPLSERECEISLTYFLTCLHDQFFTSSQYKEFVERVTSQYFQNNPS